MSPERAIVIAILVFVFIVAVIFALKIAQTI